MTPTNTPLCKWCQARPAEGRLATIDVDREIEVSEETVLLCRECGEHFHDGRAQDRPGECRYEYELFSEDSFHL